jgi:hypothetical protein
MPQLIAAQVDRVYFVEFGGEPGGFKRVCIATDRDSTVCYRKPLCADVNASWLHSANYTPGLNIMPVWKKVPPALAGPARTYDDGVESTVTSSKSASTN